MVHSLKELAARGGDRTQWQYTYIVVYCKIMRQVVKTLINADRKGRYTYTLFKIHDFLQAIREKTIAELTVF